MTLHQFDVILVADSEIPKDNIVNTWHFYTAADPAIDEDNVRDMLANFYTVDPEVVGGGGGAVASYFAEDSINGTALVKAYNLGAEPPREPVYESTFDIPSLSTTNALPTEVALCISFLGAPATGAGLPNRRNRKYLGPFGSVALALDGRPIPELRATIAGAGRRLIEEATASISWEWVAYSGTTGYYGPVISGWCDDSWDTQRRRGPAPTTRTTFTDSTPTDT